MKLKIRDYKKIEALQLDVEGLVGIVGPNGSGKSTIIDALRSVFYNVAGDTVRWGASSSAVGVQFEESVVWRRVSGSSLYIFRGKKYEKLGRAVPEEIVESLNIEPISVEDEKHYVNFFFQLDAPLIIKLSPSRLYSLIVKSLDADKIEKASKNVEKYILDLKEELHDLDVRELEYKQEKEKLERAILLTAEVDLWQEAVGAYEEHVVLLEKLKDLQEKYRMSQKVLPFLQRVAQMLLLVEEKLVLANDLLPVYAEYAKLLDIKARYAPVDKVFLSRVVQLEVNLVNLGSALEVELNINNLKRLQDSYKVCKGATERLAKVNDVTQRVSALLDVYPSELVDLRRLRERLQFVQQNINSLKGMISELEILTSGKVCPTCGKPLEVDYENS